MLLSGLGSSLQINENASWAPTFMSPLFSSQIQCDPPSGDQDFAAMTDCGVTCETNSSFVAYVAFVGCFVSVIEVTDAWALKAILHPVLQMWQYTESPQERVMFWWPSWRTPGVSDTPLCKGAVVSSAPALSENHKLEPHSCTSEGWPGLDGS